MQPYSACILLIFLDSALDLNAQPVEAPVDYVSPNIGGIGQLLQPTIPYVQYPHGMMRVAPITTPGITDRYLADKIYGFPVGPAILMATSGKSSKHAKDNASDFDHDFETATPYYYETDLQTWNIRAELTTSAHAAYSRFTCLRSGQAYVVLSMKDHGDLEVVGSKAIQGSEDIGTQIGRTSGPQGETREYFYVEFAKPFSDFSTWQGADGLSRLTKRMGDDIGFVGNLAAADGEPIAIRAGISYISAEQARRNLQREIPEGGTRR